MSDIKNNKLVLIVICFFLFVIPFFWLKPGEMDLGGDTSRLYFYDPKQFFLSSLYIINPQGIGSEFTSHFMLPFVFLLWVMKFFLKSGYLLITLFNSLTLVASFLSVYAVAREFRLHYYASLIAGLFYIFLPISTGGGWDKASYDHMQIFINPLMFFLFLRYIHTLKIHYLISSLLITFIFFPNFVLPNPKVYSFFLLSIAYLWIYAVFIKKIKISKKVVFSVLFLYLFLHSFDLILQLKSIFTWGSVMNTRFFSGTEKSGSINLFLATADYVKPSVHLLGGLPSSSYTFRIFDYLSFLFPSVIILGAFLNTKVKKWGGENSLNFLLLFTFFLLSFFLVTAKVTNTGMSLYVSLFSIPGFGMFRSFVGQWAHVFIFFYSLVFGYSFFYLISSAKKFKGRIFLAVTAVLILIGTGFITGGIVKRPIITTAAGYEVKPVFEIDPRYEKFLNYLKNINLDMKILSLPFVDHFYQIVGGKNGGVYLGPSTISYLTRKNDFGSSQILQPFTDVLLESAKNQDFDTFNNIFPIYGIRYLFYNSDPYIYENFKDFPYQQMRQFMPSDQKKYEEFVKKLAVKPKINFGENYHILSVNDEFILPHIYIPKEIVFYNTEASDSASFILKNFITESNKEVRKMFINSQAKKYYNSEKNKKPEIIFEKINPTKYKIKVFDAEDPYFLVFSEAFNSNWKLFLSESQLYKKEKNISTSYFNGEIKEGFHKDIFLDNLTFENWGRKPVAYDNHFIANLYANGWYISPSDTGGRKDYEFILEMTSQRLFYIGIVISVLTFICLSFFLMILWFSKKKK